MPQLKVHSQHNGNFMIKGFLWGEGRAENIFNIDTFDTHFMNIGCYIE